MSNIINFDNWSVYEDAPYGSGASRKQWIINHDTGQKGVFKFPKVHTYSQGQLTGEHWAEKIASDIAKLIHIPCANVDIGIYKGELGAISYMAIDDSKEILVEGIQYISNKYVSYNVDRLYDEDTGKRYSLQMIRECIEETGLVSDFMIIPVFDCLIGNSDRHHSNWGIVVSQYGNPLRISPLYDNSSSLCCREPEESIKDILRDSNRFNAIVDSKSKSSIRWMDQTKTRHFDMLRELNINFHNETHSIVENIYKYMSECSVQQIIESVPECVMSNIRKELVFKFIMTRKNKILNVYGYQ